MKFAEKSTFGVAQFKKMFYTCTGFSKYKPE